MKIYGHTADASEEDVTAQEMAEISVMADAKELRMIAEFLQRAADNMDRMGSTYDHEHLSDVNHSFEGSPHFVVVRPR